MVLFTYEDVLPPIIDNTIMQKRFIDGVHKQYLITPADGYVLHDKGRDWDNVDDEGNVIETFLGYTTGTATCAASYDFTANPRQFYAAPESDVPEDHIFNNPS